MVKSPKNENIEIQRELAESIMPEYVSSIEESPD